MFQFLAVTQADQPSVGARRRLFPRRFLHSIPTLTISVFAALVAQVSYSQPVNAKSSERPNIVLIMSDDMGYSDIGCYGSEVETPNLDRLAEHGLRFTQFYNTGRCCPTRASLLTGLYPHQAGVGYMMHDRGVDGYRGDLNRDCVTIAEVLSAGGYATYASGKWHVTRQRKPAGDADKYNWPLHRGFKRFYGTIHGACSFWDPSTLCRDNRMITAPSDPEYLPDEPYYYTDAISDQAARFIRENNQDQPFFLYVSYTAAHWPMHARPRDIAKYKGRYDDGYAAIRQARFDKMKRLGVIKHDAELSWSAGSWDDVKHKQWEAACMEVYAAMVDSMDQGIGRIVKSLRDKGQLDNTMICFLQDNGGCAEGGGRSLKPNPRAAEPTMPRIGPDVQHYFGSSPAQTRDGWPVRGGRVMPGPADTYIGYGKNWANVSNTPFRLYKHWVHEGGISTPLIVHWPAGIAAPNELRHQPSHLIDLMATCVDVSGAEYPAERMGRAIKPMEGLSLVPTFTNSGLERSALYWETKATARYASATGNWSPSDQVAASRSIGSCTTSRRIAASCTTWLLSNRSGSRG